jgi:thioredoxin-dependent peroxiredoxin
MMLPQLLIALLALAPEGSPAPDFTAQDQAGHLVRLKSLRGKQVVLYFYPKDKTSGCTVEARGFRDSQSDFDKAGAVVLGISSQNAKSHEAFAQAEQLGFSLLDDHDRRIAKAYDVGQMVPLSGLDSRVTFLIDRAGIVRKVWPKVDPSKHAQEVLEAIKALK